MQRTPAVRPHPGVRSLPPGVRGGLLHDPVRHLPGLAARGVCRGTLHYFIPSQFPLLITFLAPPNHHIQVDELQASDIDKYHCPKCEPLCGPSIMQKETNWHRNDPHDPQVRVPNRQVETDNQTLLSSRPPTNLCRWEPSSLWKNSAEGGSSPTTSI